MPPVVIEEKIGWQNQLPRHAARHGGGQWSPVGLCLRQCVL